MLSLSSEGLHWPGIRPALGDGMRPHKRTVVWVDGVFDMMHFGHQNMCRQARELGKRLRAALIVPCRRLLDCWSEQRRLGAEG